MVAEHITNIPCDKHSGRRAHTQMLIVHSIESPLANGFAVSMAYNWLGKWYQPNGALIEASSNVIVSPDTLVRSVHTDYAAWHASWANSLSVGYEQSGYAAFSREQWLTPGGRDQIDRLAREMAQDAAHYGIPLRWLTAAEVRAIANGDRTIKGLVTHAVIDPGNRTDPGDQYPYDVLLESIKAYADGTTPQSTIQEDDMPLNAEDKKFIQDEIERRHVVTRDVIRASGFSDENKLFIQTAVEVRAVVTRDVIKSAVGTLAQFTPGIDADKLEEAMQDAVAKAVKEGLAAGLDIDVTVGGRK